MPLSRFPLVTSLVCCFCLAAIVGTTIHYVVADRLYGAALNYEYGDPNTPLWLKHDRVNIIAGAVGGAFAVPSFLWAFAALRRPRIHPTRTGWIAVSSFALIGLPVGVTSMIAVQESTRASLGNARFGVAPAVGLIVGAVIAFACNAWARRRWSPS